MNTFKDVAVITAAGGVFVFWVGRPVLHALRTRSWPLAQGTIESSHIASRRSSTHYTHVRRTSSSHARFLVIQYTYTVAGQTYTGNRWSLDGRSPTSAMWVWSEAAVLSQYAQGTPVEVYYDPANPAYSVLTRKLSWMTYAVLAFGLLFFLSGLSGLLRLAWRFIAH